MVTIVPDQATASVPPVSSCRLTSFISGQYAPMYTTVCGPHNRPPKEIERRWMKFPGGVFCLIAAFALEPKSRE